MNLVLEYLNSQNKTLKKLVAPPPPPPKDILSSFLKVFLNVLLGIGSVLVEVLASSILGPVGGMMVGVGADIITNVAGDYINGTDPWSLDNVMFNVVLPIASIPGRAKGISKIRKNKILGIGEITDDVDMIKLAKQLHNNDISDLGNVNKLNRRYNQLLDSHNDLDLKKIVKEKQVKTFFQNQNDKKEIIEFLTKKITEWNKKASYFDPNYAVSKTFSYILEKTGYKKKINKKISFFIKKIKTEFTDAKRVFKKTTKSLMIPLNHTTAPWIKGIKLFKINNTLNYYNVAIFFHKGITKKKPPVYLKNKSWINIKAFLDAPSAGKYYINNISWGWEIGLMLRKNNLSILSKFSSINFSSHYYKLFYQSSQLVKNIIYAIDKISNFEDYTNEWMEAITTKLPVNLVSGLTDGVKGTSFPKVIIRTMQTGDSKYVIRYSGRVFSKYTRKKIKNRYGEWEKNTTIMPYLQHKRKK